ncbi:MAG: hypothetical protein V1818_00100 [Candidatus Aenigmatarchaeota archaeon]
MQKLKNLKKRLIKKEIVEVEYCGEIDEERHVPVYFHGPFDINPIGITHVHTKTYVFRPVGGGDNIVLENMSEEIEKDLKKGKIYSILRKENRLLPLFGKSEKVII